MVLVIKESQFQIRKRKSVDNKSLPWRKKPSEKTIVSTTVKGIDQETQKPRMAKEVGSAKVVRSLNEKLASVLLESHGNNKLAREDIAGQEKQEGAVFIKKERDSEAMKPEADSNVKLIQSNAELNHCRDEQEERKRLEGKLVEMSKGLADLAIENANLSKILVLKEKLVDEMHTRASQTSAEFKALMTRLDSTEKENAFLKYEFYMLEKELEVRNEELEYSHRQHLESVRKITMLESECQRLSLLTRKKQLSPAASPRMKKEVEISTRKPNPVRDLVLRGPDRSLESPDKNINFLVEQLRVMEEKNRTLKEILSKKNTELSKTASRLVPTELYPIVGFETCSDDCKSIEVSDISLMDDFAEMERLALVSSQGSDCSPSNGKELVRVNQTAGEKPFDWLQQVLNAILKEQRLSKRSLTELLEDIKIALGCINHSHSESEELQEKKILLDKLKKMESDRKDMDDKIEKFTLQLQESKQRVERLELELETTKESKGEIEDQMENQKSINEDLDTQLTVARAKLNEVLQKFTSLEVELEEKSNCCEELEVTCLELQLQLESVAKKDSVNYSIVEGAQTQTGSEIAAASLKLAECQETILNLGKQLKALATPREVAMFDKVFSLTSSKNTSGISKKPRKRFSLHDRMVAEDDSKAIVIRSPAKDATTLSSNDDAKEEKTDPKLASGATPVVSLAIVSSKKQGLGLLRRLLMGRKKGNS